MPDGSTFGDRIGVKIKWSWSRPRGPLMRVTPISLMSIPPLYGERSVWIQFVRHIQRIIDGVLREKKNPDPLGDWTEA